MEITSQPNHGLLIVGNCQLTRLEQVLAQSNLGHGIVFDEGVITSRTNRAAPGIVTVDTCWALSNAGNGLVGGHSSDTDIGAFRMLILNLEAADNALTAGVRYSADQVWLHGQNNEVRGCAFGGDDATGGIYIAGREISLINNRYIENTRSVTIGVDPVLSLTSGVVIDGMRVVNTAQNPAIVVSDTTATSRIHVRTYSTGNVTSLITAGVPISEGAMNGPPLNVIRKTTSQIVSNSTTLVDDDQLKIALAANEIVGFRFNIRYSGDASADIKFGVTAPTGGTVRWGAAQSITIGTGDAASIENEATESTTKVFGSSASGRWATLIGRVNNSTTAGNLKLQWAQNSAVVANTSVLEGSWMEVYRQN